MRFVFLTLLSSMEKVSVKQRLDGGGSKEYSFAEYAKFVSEYTLDKAHEMSGVPKKDLEALARLGDDIPTGHPVFHCQRVCEDIPCMKACPSEALRKDLATIYEARMGLAVLLDHENCLNHLGLRCDVCFRTCPLIDFISSIPG